MINLTITGNMNQDEFKNNWMKFQTRSIETISPWNNTTTWFRSRRLLEYRKPRFWCHIHWQHVCRSKPGIINSVDVIGQVLSCLKTSWTEQCTRTGFTRRQTTSCRPLWLLSTSLLHNSSFRLEWVMYRCDYHHCQRKKHSSRINREANRCVHFGWLDFPSRVLFLFPESNGDQTQQSGPPRFTKGS